MLAVQSTQHAPARRIMCSLDLQGVQSIRVAVAAVLPSRFRGSVSACSVSPSPQSVTLMLRGTHACPFHKMHGSTKIWVHVVGPFAQLRCCSKQCAELAGIWRPLDLRDQRVAESLGSWRQLSLAGDFARRQRQHQRQAPVSEVAHGHAASAPMEATNVNLASPFLSAHLPALAVASAVAANVRSFGAANETADASRPRAAVVALAGREMPRVSPESVASSLPTPAAASTRGPAFNTAASIAIHGGVPGAVPRPFPGVAPPRPLHGAPPTLLPTAAAPHVGPGSSGGGVVHPPTPQFLHVPPQVRPPPPRPINSVAGAAAAAAAAVAAAALYRQSFDPRRPRPAAAVAPMPAVAPPPRPFPAPIAAAHPTAGCTKPCCTPGVGRVFLPRARVNVPPARVNVPPARVSVPPALAEAVFRPPRIPYPILGAPLPVPLLPGPPHSPVNFPGSVLGGLRPPSGNDAPGLWEMLSLAAWSPPGVMPALALPALGWASKDIQFRTARTRYYALAKLLHPDRWALTWASARLFVPRVWQALVDVGDDGDAAQCPATSGDCAGNSAGGVGSTQHACCQDGPREPGADPGTSERETVAPRSSDKTGASIAMAPAVVSSHKWTEGTLRLAAEEVFRRVRAAYESLCALKN